jgi:hypothetical protein
MAGAVIDISSVARGRHDDRLTKILPTVGRGRNRNRRLHIVIEQ